MTAIDKSRIVGQEPQQLDEFSCGICHEVVGQPLVTPCCQQPFCRLCITQWLARDNTCPNDRQPLTIKALTAAHRFVANFIDKMKVKCRYSGSGCPSVHNFGEDANHSKVCPYGKCRHCDAIDISPDHDCRSTMLEENLLMTGQLNTKLQNNRKKLEKFRRKNLGLILRNENLKSANATAIDELAQLRQEVNDLRRQLQEVYVGNVKYCSKKVDIGQLDAGQRSSIIVSLCLDYHPKWDRVINDCNWDDVILAFKEDQYYRDSVFDMIEDKIRSSPRFGNLEFRKFYKI